MQPQVHSFSISFPKIRQSTSTSWERRDKTPQIDLSPVSLTAPSPRMFGAIATEEVLRRIWDRPEEDEACRDL